MKTVCNFSDVGQDWVCRCGRIKSKKNYPSPPVVYCRFATEEDQPARQGVGSLVAILIHDRLGIRSCWLCSELIREMNEKGPDWCEANKKAIAGRMLDNSKRMQRGLRDVDNSLALTREDKLRLERLKYIPTPIQMFGAVKLIKEAIRLHREQGE